MGIVTDDNDNRDMFRLTKKMKETVSAGFTLIEVLIVLVIISIAAMAAIPMMSSAGSIQIRSAASMVAADLAYAKGIAISRQQNYTVVFDVSNETYQIEDAAGDVIGHPVKTGFDYVVDFSSDSRFSRVDISGANFDDTSSIEFDYLGSPYNGSGGAMNSGVITLEAGEATMTVTVEAVTGYITIN